jgi:thiol:disulfide interchange protein DsbD
VADACSHVARSGDAEFVLAELHRVRAMSPLLLAWEQWTRLLAGLRHTDALDLAVEDDARDAIDRLAALVAGTPLDYAALGPGVSEILWKTLALRDWLAGDFDFASNPKLKTPNSKFQTPNSKLIVQNPELRTLNPELRTLNSEPARGLVGTLVLAFLGGLILNLMPCVFPVLGIKILGFVNQAGADRRKVKLHGLVFALGVLTSFWVLAGLMLALRAGGKQVGWGFQLQEPGVVFVLAVVMLALALNLSGLFEVGLSAVGAGAQLQAKSGFAGSFFTGVLATVVATPCSAPFLVTALSASITLPPAVSLVMFTLIGLGLATPYLVLSLFPGSLRFLPRPGAWMETFKQFMSFPLYLTVGWLVWVLAGQTRDNDYALLYVLAGLTLVALAAWFYGRYAQAYGKPLRKMIGRGLALVLLGAGLLTGWPKAPLPLQSGTGYHLTWQKWSPEAVAKLRTENRVIYVDFTARWCFTCQTNKAAVFSSKAVLDALAAKDVVLLKADWTSRDPEITAALTSFHRNAVPFDLIYAPGRAEPVLLPELLTADIVLHALELIAPATAK